MIISRSIHINAPLERVFALASDPVQRARLNPDVVPIRVELENGEALRTGSVCHFRLQIGNRIADYRTRVTELIPNRRIVSTSDTAVPFEIEIETEVDAPGTLLTQRETFEPTDEMLLEAAPAGATGRLQQLIDTLLPFLDLEWARRQHAWREEMLRNKLEENLGRWLEAIKHYLETARTEAP